MSSRWRDPRRTDSRFPGGGRRELQRRRAVPPSAWSLRDKLNVFGACLFGLLAFFSPIILQAIRQRELIARHLESWRAAYGLKDSQMTELREIEFKFHDMGDPFSETVRPSNEALLLHEKQLAAAMGPGTGETYLAHLSGNDE